MFECKVSRAVGMFFKIKIVFSHTTLQQLYYTMLQPLLLFNIIVWVSKHISYLKKLKIIQNKTLRVASVAHLPRLGKAI